MRPVQNGDILEMTYVQEMNNQTLLNVLHYRIGVAPAASVEGDDIVNIINGVVNEGAGGVPAILKARNSDKWNLLGIRYQWVYDHRYTFQMFNDEGGVGERLLDAYPQNVGSTITKRGIDANRHGIGSVHLAGHVLGDIENGVVAAAVVTNNTLLANKWMQEVDISDVEDAVTAHPIIYNKVAPALSVNWVSSVVQTTARVNRRRTVGVGI